MILKKLPLGSVDAEPIRLFAFGSTGIDFASKIHEGITGPSADRYIWQEPEDLSETVRVYNFNGAAFLFIVIGVDATDYEAGQAAMLATLASQSKVVTVGLFVESPTKTQNQSAKYVNDQHLQAAILLSFLTDLVDGHVQKLSIHSAHDLDAVRWVYGTLRSLANEGSLILEPAWDLCDIVEVLDLPGSRLILQVQTVEIGETVADALGEALSDLKAKGIELELASGAVLIVWQGPLHRLTVRQFSEIGRIVHKALGAGGQHLLLTGRAELEVAQLLKIGACVTLVISFGSQHFSHDPGRAKL